MVKIAHAQLMPTMASASGARLRLERARLVQLLVQHAGVRAARCRARCKRNEDHQCDQCRPSADRPATSSSARPAPAPARRRRSMRCGSRTGRSPRAVRPASARRQRRSATRRPRRPASPTPARRSPRRSRKCRYSSPGWSRRARRRQRSSPPGKARSSSCAARAARAAASGSRSTTGDHRNLKL